MMFSNNVTQWNSYTWFYYLGIFLFTTHIFIYGIGIDLSYFGLLLLWIGWKQPSLYNWVFYLLWVFLIIDIFATVHRLKTVLGFGSPDDISEALTDVPTESLQDDTQEEPQDDE